MNDIIYIVCRKLKGAFKEPVMAFTSYAKAEEFKNEMENSKPLALVYAGARYYISEVKLNNEIVKKETKQ